MEGKVGSEKQQKKAKGSVLEWDVNYLNKVLSRESSVGQSSRREPAGIPFKWEMQPGTPKANPRHAGEEIIPPPSPSPLMQSRGLSTQPSRPPGDYWTPTEWLRKKFKMIQRSTSKLVQTSWTKKSSTRIGDSNRVITASHKSLYPWLSSGHGRATKKDEEDAKLNCNTNRDMSGTLVRVTRRI